MSLMLKRHHRSPVNTMRSFPTSTIELDRSRELTRDWFTDIPTTPNIESVFHKTMKHEYDPEWGVARRTVAHIIESLACDLFMTFILLLNLAFAILIVDLEAVDEQVPLWMRVSMRLLVAIYCLEVAARVYVFRWKFFLNFVNQFDLVIVVAEVAVAVFEEVLADEVKPIDLAPYRVIRVVRLLRSAKIMVLFRSLYLLVNGMAGAVRAVLWALVMISLSLILCSIFAVAVIHPYVLELAATTDVFAGCMHCTVAYSSVWRAYTTFFQQIVVGDSWGTVTIPIMEAHPWTAVFFIPAFLLIQLGLINMILAVIVDRAEEARQANFEFRLELKEQELQLAYQSLRNICASMDTDGDGELTIQEVFNGYDNNKEFHEILSLMDVAKEDMQCVFNILDQDKSGTCTYGEFVDALWKMKTQDSHTLLVFIKSYVTDVRRSLEEQIGMLKNDIGIKLKELHAVHVDYEHALEEEPDAVLKGVGPSGRLSGTGSRRELDSNGDAQCRGSPQPCDEDNVFPTLTKSLNGSQRSLLFIPGESSMEINGRQIEPPVDTSRQPGVKSEFLVDANVQLNPKSSDDDLLHRASDTPFHYLRGSFKKGIEHSRDLTSIADLKISASVQLDAKMEEIVTLLKSASRQIEHKIDMLPQMIAAPPDFISDPQAAPMVASKRRTRAGSRPSIGL